MEIERVGEDPDSRFDHFGLVGALMSQNGRIEMVADLEITAVSGDTRSSSDRGDTAVETPPVVWRIFTETAPASTSSPSSKADDSLPQANASDRLVNSASSRPSDRTAGTTQSPPQPASAEPGWLVIQGPPGATRSTLASGLRVSWRYRGAVSRWIAATGQPLRVQSGNRVWLRAFPKPSFLGRALGMPGITLQLFNRNPSKKR